MVWTYYPKSELYEKQAHFVFFNIKSPSNKFYIDFDYVAIISNLESCTLAHGILWTQIISVFF